MIGPDEQELARLLQAALAGSEKDYALFLERTAVIVRAFARRRIVQNSLDAEDIVQETLLAIHLKRHTWMTDAPVLPWIYAIARFKLIDAFRRRKRRMEVDLEEAADVALPVEDRLTSHEIDHALSRLGEVQRSVVSAVSVSGFSIREAALRLNMSEGAVRVSLHRGLAAISRVFGRG